MMFHRATHSRQLRTLEIGWMAVFVALATSVVALAAMPRIPRNDNEILEVLPRALLARRSEITLLRRQLAMDPNNAELAIRIARRYLQIGSQQGDPRYDGYARAALQPWWEAADAPPAVLLLRAKLKEKAHDYDLALADLALLVEQQPHDVQAWVERINIYRVQGRYREALDACDFLKAFAGSARALVCRAPLQAVTGQAETAYDAIADMLPTAKERWPAALPWMLTMQAKIAWALGRDEQAERHFRDGLRHNAADLYLLRDYADFLLDRRRDQEALSLLQEHVSDNGILLRAAIAARRLGKADLAAKWKRQLEFRFDEIRLRGNQPHGRFEARHALELQDDPERALNLALANWQKQKERRDTRNVLEAAIAANDRAAAQPVLHFLTKHQTQDAELHRLAQQLERN